MKVLPFRHVYDDPVARRIYFIYGDVFDYENIDDDTMRSSVPSFFGNGNITFFEHISLMIRAGEARNAQGEDSYVSNLDAYKLPINFMTGEHNRMFVPAGLQRTYDTLRRGNGPEQLPPHGLRGLRAPRPLAGPERRARRVPDRPRRAGAPQLMSTTADDSPPAAPRTSTPGCATSSTTRSWRRCRTAARGASRRASRSPTAR